MTPRLPSSIAELRGLRARRYVRVSTDDQGTKYGPERQHRDTLESIERLGLLEVGEPFVDEQSAWSRSETRPALQALVRAAMAGEFDVLVVSYFSRWSRDAETGLRIRRELHAAGVVLYFVDEEFLSSDADQLERFVTEAAASEVFSIKLSRTITKTFRAKFDRYGDQAGTAPAGFLRTPQPEARLAIDPSAMPAIVAVFERYAAGDVSYRELAAIAAISEPAVRAIVTNPLYNGWAVRGRRRADQRRVAAPWRSAPPVSDDLWARVVDVRLRRLRVAGRRRPVSAHLLAKLMVCTCGRGLPADTVSVRGRVTFRRYRHEGCDRWSQGSVKAEVLEAPIAAQLAGLRLDAAALTRIRALASRPAPVDRDLRRGQLEHELRRKATDHAARRLTTEAYLAEHTRITSEIDALADVAPSAPIDDADQVIARLQAFRETWAGASPEAQAALVRQVYRRIVVEDRRIVEVELTELAKRHGFMDVLSERVDVVVLARPAGARRTQSITVAVPIVGRRAWLRAARSA